MSLNKIDKVKIHSKMVSKNFAKSIHRRLNSLNPNTLKRIYKDTGIKVNHIFVKGKVKLIIGKDSIDYINHNKKGYSYGKNNSYRNKLIHNLEEYISKDEKEYVNKISKELDSDIDVVTYVDKISLIKNKMGLIEKIIVNTNGKDYYLTPKKVLNEAIFDGKYSMVLDNMIGLCFEVNTLDRKDAPLVEYYAHVNIDEVYGLEGNWGLVDMKGNEIIKPQYIYPFIECGDNLQVMLSNSTKTIKGKKRIITLKHGLIDRKGNVIIPIKYLYMDCMDNSGIYFRVADPKSLKSAVLDKNNNIIIPFDYEYIDPIPDSELCINNGYGTIYPDNIYQVKVSNNDLYGIYDLKLKKEIIKPKYKYMKIIDYNKFMIGDDYENCNKIINEKDELIHYVTK